MKRFVVSLSLGIVATWCATSSFAAETKVIQGVISKVVDGDTLWVTPKGQKVNEANGEKPKTLKVRMVGMDAPESHLPAPGGMVAQAPWGDEATVELGDICPLGAKVRLESNGEDKYKRTLGRVYINDTDINLEMVKQGWAIPYIICEAGNCNEKFFEREKVAEYLAACDKARSKKLGIWNPKNLLKEMPFEFRLRMQGRPPEKWVGNFETKQYVAPADYKEIDVCDRIFFMTEKDATKAGFDITKAE